MSSTYRILCLSHDPAVTAGDDDYSSPEEAVAAIAAGVHDHQRCDLLIGRYSYPLVEVGCPPSISKRAGQLSCTVHSNTEWADAAWLRLLAAAHQSADDELRALAGDRYLCHWPWERLRRLRDELGFTVTDHSQDRGSEEATRA